MVKLYPLWGDMGKGALEAGSRGRDEITRLRRPLPPLAPPYKGGELKDAGSPIKSGMTERREKVFGEMAFSRRGRSGLRLAASGLSG